MNTTFRVLAAAVAAAVIALTSCDSDISLDGGAGQTPGKARVIAVSFQGNSTKTQLAADGLTPKFQANDKIKVSNGTASEDCTVSVNGGNATISTSLEGSLTAVYPANAAKMDGNAIDGILVPTVQDGTFASANICMTTIEEDATEAIFENQTAVFKITPGAGSGTKYVEVITSCFEIANSVPGVSTYTSLHKIHVCSTSADPVYVSILVPDDLTIGNLGFADGSNIKGLKDNTTAVAVNTLYTVDSNNWSTPYVEIGGLKWATMNVGATTVSGSPSTCYGDHFAWGETEPYYSSISFTSASAATITWKTSPKDYSTRGYDLANYKYCNGTNTTFTKYCNDSAYGQDSYTDSKTVLDPEDDAAIQNWGSCWRMPTVEEFNALYTACTGDESRYYCESAALPGSIDEGGVYWSADYDGVAGLLFVDKTDTSKRVFFPAAGYFESTSSKGKSFQGGGEAGYYRSSSLTYNPKQAYFLFIEYVGAVSPMEFGRRADGFTVRALSE